MKKQIVTVLVLSFVAGSVFGQEFRTKDRGILFTLQGLNNLGPNAYSGGIGAKLFMGGIAVRPLFVFNIENQNEDPEGMVGDKTTNSTFGFGGDAIKHISNSRISPYVGAGLGVAFGKQKQEFAHATGDKPNIWEQSTFRVLLRTLIGVEIFLFKNFSLAGEYRLTYTSTSTTDKFTAGASGNKTEDKTKTSVLGLGTAGQLILTIYIK